eukprot:scaffold731_cov261-Pinguiococcus_pyrenoidosus.AAC.24
MGKANPDSEFSANFPYPPMGELLRESFHQRPANDATDAACASEDVKAARTRSQAQKTRKREFKRRRRENANSSEEDAKTREGENPGKKTAEKQNSPRGR